MKKVLLTLLIFMFVVVVKADEVNIEFGSNHTFTYNNKTYNYKLKETHDEIDISFVYDDECEYGDVVQDYVKSFYVSDFDCKNNDLAHTILDKIEEHENATMEDFRNRDYEKQLVKERPFLLVVSIIFGVAGLVCIIIPKFVWYIYIGRLLSKSEAENAPLMYYRIFGVILLLVAFIVYSYAFL